MFNSSSMIPSSILNGQVYNNGTLCLSQIESFEPVPEFQDNTGTHWGLVKSAFNSTIEIPDPKNVQIVDYWNHVFPGLKENIYVYVVEGIKQPRVDTERPTRILYQWFSTRNVPSFMPTMITEQEWRKANVYAAEIIDTRVQKLNALCKIGQAPQEQKIPEAPIELIKLGKTNEQSTGTKA